MIKYNSKKLDYFCKYLMLQKLALQHIIYYIKLMICFSKMYWDNKRDE